MSSPQEVLKDMDKRQSHVDELIKQSGEGFPLKHISTYRGDDIAIPWAIDGIIEQGGHTTIFGASESYKTFLGF